MASYTFNSFLFLSFFLFAVRYHILLQEHCSIDRNEQRIVEEAKNILRQSLLYRESSCNWVPSIFSCARRYMYVILARPRSEKQRKHNREKRVHSEQLYFSALNLTGNLLGYQTTHTNIECLEV